MLLDGINSAARKKTPTKSGAETPEVRSRPTLSSGMVISMPIIGRSHSLVFTPLVGLIIVLLSEKLPDGQKKGLGCIGGILAFLGFLCLLVFLLMLLGGGAMIAAL